MSEEVDTLRQETSLEQYAQPGKRIAKGGQGTVYKYTHGPTGNVYAAKVLYYDFENIDPERNRNNQVFILREQYVTPRFVHVSRQLRPTPSKANLCLGPPDQGAQSLRIRGGHCNHHALLPPRQSGSTEP